MSRMTIVVDGVMVVVDGNGVEVIAIGGRKVILPLPRPSAHGAKPVPKPAFGGHSPMAIKTPAKPKPKKADKKPAPPPAKRAEPPKPAKAKAAPNGAAPTTELLP